MKKIATLVALVLAFFILVAALILWKKTGELSEADDSVLVPVAADVRRRIA
jgi:hypothetical protein